MWLCCLAGPAAHARAQRQMAIERSAEEPPPPAAASVRVITLNHGDHLDSTLYRFEKGCRLQFRPGPSLLGRKVFLYTNYVGIDEQDESSGGDEAEFSCEQYRALEWRREERAGFEGEGDALTAVGEGEWEREPRLTPLGTGALVADEDLSCEITLTRAGPFHYYFVYETACDGKAPQGSVEDAGGAGGAAEGAAGSGWWQVTPTVRPRADAPPLALDALCCQTVLTKCLGPLARWESVLRVAHEAGYNAVHFTPVQELGGSGSSYSIANQLRLDPRYGAALADLRNMLDKLRHQWNMVFICDVVLNHTANETPWLTVHPEATYNARDCPYLRPAALLDAALATLSAAIARGELTGAGLPPRIDRPEQMEAVRAEINRRSLALRLEECFQCDASAITQQFIARARNTVPSLEGAAGASEALRLVADPQRRRLAATVDMALALRLYNVRRADVSAADEEARLAEAGAALRRALDALNEEAAGVVRDHLRAAVDNCIAGITYFRLQSDGPKIAEVSERNPLVAPYFTWPLGALELSPPRLEAMLQGEGGAAVMAHNGWVMAADPLHDFAARAADGRVYLRRELIAWGDSVKLRYGAGPGDSPFLWAQMREYVESMAEIFDGVRLDNCHSTPPHVAQALLRAARKTRPDLYVVAELFTNADHVDNIFVNRLGITSLIREAMSAWDSHELGRQLHRFGGQPVGAFLPRGVSSARPLVAPALLMDLTHDNPSLVEKRCVFDALPTMALAAMATGAVGSTRGYDDLVPHQVDVVTEERLYCAWSEPRASGVLPLLPARRALNHLHQRLVAQGYTEIFVDQMDADTVAVTRHHPVTRHSIILVAVTAFRAPAPDARHTPRALRFDGELREVLLEATLVHRTARDLRPPGEFARHPQYINGLEEYECELREGVPLAESAVFAGSARDGDDTALQFRALRPGTVVAVLVAPRAPHAAALHALHAMAPRLHAHQDALRVRTVLRELDLSGLSALLYRCDAEERDAGAGGVYDVPGYGPLVYAGLQGVSSLLAEVRPRDDLGHPLCANLRAGTWLPEYMAARLEREPALHVVAARVREALASLRALPYYLRPAYFELVVAALHGEATRAVAVRLARWCAGGPLTRALALCSVQLCARVPSAPLPPLAGGPSHPPSLSAGLPHFATGYMRCWGRDTFISLRGLLLLTGRADDARAHILGFAACLRHGLIPNLLDGGARARFNCRDAVWWWLHAIKQYCTEVAGGETLLHEPVLRLFPRDDSAPGEGGVTQPLHTVMQEALDAHFQGRAFRERNAGRDIDAHMTERGFDVQVGVHPETGFVFGGNDANCGTWMDKMGSSERAGNRGRPATPRDGSAVELVALSYSVVTWLQAQHRARRYAHAGVTRETDSSGRIVWTWQQWAERIHQNFERYFWVPAEPSAADARPDLVHRRAIYKDTHGASQPWADYQLRCNYAVSMAVAPELFDARHAWLALDQVERHLLGPLGLKTLDPADWNYRPDYDNADDSTDPSVAHGFNYHQGPEWLWPLGFYLRARLLFADAAGQRARTVGRVLRALAPLAAELRASPWRGLPELTNAGGKFCSYSCSNQAWSAATVLEVLYELRQARRATALA